MSPFTPSASEAIRSDQLRHGQAQITRKPQGRLGAERPKFAGHESVLRSIQADGRMIRIEKCDGSIVYGKLVAFDKYTLSVLTQQSSGDVRRVLFKHDISEFSAQEPVKAD